jgi:hypothetical protein
MKLQLLCIGTEGCRERKLTRIEGFTVSEGQISDDTTGTQPYKHLGIMQLKG